MGFIKRDPIKDLVFLQDRMSRIFDEALSRYKSGYSSGAWFPLVDIYETEENIVLKAELPGMTSGDVSVEVDENAIVLKGERKFDKNLTEENYHRMERFYGTFERVFSLPNIVDKKSVRASFKDGVLEITVPRAYSKKQQGIKIKVE